MEKKQTLKLAYLQIGIAIIFAILIVFLDLTQTTANVVIALWFVVSSLLTALSVRK